MGMSFAAAERVDLFASVCLVGCLVGQQRLTLQPTWGVSTVLLNIQPTAYFTSRLGLHCPFSLAEKEAE